MFKVGQKIVCVVDFSVLIPIRRKTFIGESFPIKSKIYTIRELDGDYVRLKEIINPIFGYVEGIKECSFSLDGFRPLKYDNISSELIGKIVEEKSDVSTKELEPAYVCG